MKRSSRVHVGIALALVLLAVAAPIAASAGGIEPSRSRAADQGRTQNDVMPADAPGSGGAPAVAAAGVDAFVDPVPEAVFSPVVARAGKGIEPGPVATHSHIQDDIRADAPPERRTGTDVTEGRASGTGTAASAANDTNASRIRTLEPAGTGRVDTGHDLPATVQVRTGRVDLPRGLAPSLTNRSRLPDRPRIWVVIRIDHHSEAWAGESEGLRSGRAILRRLGYRRADVIGHATYYAGIPPGNLSRVAALPFVRSVMPIQPEWKIPASLDRRLRRRDDPVRVRVSTFAPIDHPKLTRLTPTLYRGTLAPAAVRTVQNRSPVIWIERARPRRPLLSQSRKLVGVTHLPRGGILGTSFAIDERVDGDGVRVGVIDSGINATPHPHFDRSACGCNVSIVNSYDWVDDDWNPEDRGSGHGIHVAGTVAGTSTYRDHELVGIAPNATLVVSRIFDRDGDDHGGDLKTEFDRVNGNGTDIISNSWGINGTQGRYGGNAERTDEWARDHPDTLLVFANGNAPGDDAVVSPALAKNVLAVGATTESGLENLSGISPSSVNDVSSLNDLTTPRDGRTKPDVVAPGEHITAPWLDGTYATLRGSSMATPHVSGVAALYEDVYESATANEIKANMIASTNPVANPPDPAMSSERYPAGWGSMDARNLLFNNSYEHEHVFYEGEVNQSEWLSYAFDVPPDAEKVVVSLSWFDPAVNPSTIDWSNPDTLVNELNLTVGPIGGTTYAGTHLRNNSNVAKLVIEDPQNGTWELTVRGEWVNTTGPQRYDGVIRVVTEDPTLDVSVPENTTVERGRIVRFPVRVTGTGAPVSGVWGSTVANGGLRFTCGPRKFLAGDLSQGVASGRTLCVHASEPGEHTVDVYVGSTNGRRGKIHKQVTINVTPLAANATYGTSEQERAAALVQTGDGGYLVGGTSRPADGSDVDARMRKVAPTGATEWRRAYAGSGSDAVTDAVRVLDGGYLFAGVTDSFGDSADAWVLELSEDGTERWNRTYGDAGYQTARTVLRSGDGGYLLVGWTTPPSSDRDAWIAKIDAGGDLAWSRTYGGSDLDLARAAERTAGGGFLVGGETHSFDADGGDGWVLKIDARGREDWNHTYGGSGFDTLRAAARAGDSRYAFGGYTTSFGAASTDGWILEINAQGRVLWNETYGGTGADHLHAIANTSTGGLLVAGDTESFRPLSEGSNRSTDAWVAGIGEDGTPTWSSRIGGGSYDTANAVIEPIGGGYTFAGRTESWGAGSSDAWLAATTATANELPAAAFIYTPATPKPGEQIEFNATGSEDPDDTIRGYAWDFDGDGSTDARGEVVHHSFANSGNHAVRLRVTDDDGAVNTTSVTVTVNAPPTAEFSYTPSTPTVNESVAFDASNATDPDGTVESYRWDFDGDGSYEANGSSVTHAFPSPGDQVVTLEITDDDGAVGTTTVTVPVNAPPIPRITATPGGATPGYRITFDAEGGSESHDPDGEITGYEWDLDGDGSYEGRGTTLTREFAEPGNVTVTLRVTDDDGATNATDVTVRIVDPEVSACRKLGWPGRYVLAEDVATTSGTVTDDPADRAGCIAIATDNVLIEGRGHTLTNRGDADVVVNAYDYTTSTHRRNVTLRNLTVDAAGSNYGIRYKDVHGSRIENVSLRGPVNDDGVWIAGSDVAVANADLRLSGSPVGISTWPYHDIGDYPDFEIETIDVTSVTIEGADIRGVAYGLDVDTRRNLIRNTEITATEMGVYLHDENNTVRNSTVRNASHGVAIPSAGTGSIGNSTVRTTTVRNTTVGIDLTSSGNEILGNTITGGDYGIVARFRSNVVEDNDITHNGITGVYVQRTHASNGTGGDLAVRSNDIRENGIGGYLAPNSSAGAVTFVRNRIAGNGEYGLSNNGTGTVNATRNWWGAADGPGGAFNGSGDAVYGNVTVRPFYADANLTELSGTNVSRVCSRPGCGKPTDPDGDGRYEDTDGNGRFGFNDVVVLFEHLNDAAVSDHASAYDFNGNDRVDFDDVVALFGEI